MPPCPFAIHWILERHFRSINFVITGFIQMPEKSITVYSGVDLGKFNTGVTGNILREEFKIDPDTSIIGNTSALEHHKDYFTFIDTIAILVKKKLPVKAFIIG